MLDDEDRERGRHDAILDGEKAGSEMRWDLRVNRECCCCLTIASTNDI